MAAMLFPNQACTGHRTDRHLPGGLGLHVITSHQPCLLAHPCCTPPSSRSDSWPHRELRQRTGVYTVLLFPTKCSACCTKQRGSRPPLCAVPVSSSPTGSRRCALHSITRSMGVPPRFQFWPPSMDIVAQGLRFSPIPALRPGTRAGYRRSVKGNEGRAGRRCRLSSILSVERSTIQQKDRS